MSLEEAFAPVEAHNKAVVYNQRCGHLAPKPSTKYEIKILFTYSAYGDMVIIDTNQEDNLPDSPWLFDDMQEFIQSQCTDKTQGDVMLFDGTYQKYKNGNCKFSGTTKRVYTINVN